MSNENNNKNKFGTVVNIEKYDAMEFEKEQLPYTQICNQVIQNIQNIQAGFIWIYLQSMPPTWVPNKEQIMKRFSISSATYKRHLAYLSHVRLIEYRQGRDIRGKMTQSRLVVLSGSKFNESVDNYRGIIFDTADEPAPALDLSRGIKKPVTGETGGTANEPHINTITSINAISHTKEEFFLEQSLYLDSEQQRKAIVMRQLCMKDEKAMAKHASISSDKTFSETIDECVSHYATQQSPQLVSPQRLQSWIAREIKFQKSQSLSKYPNSQEQKRLKNEALEREKKEESTKMQERKIAPTVMKSIKQHINLEQRLAKQEKDRLSLGMGRDEYHEFITRGCEAQKKYPDQF